MLPDINLIDFLFTQNNLQTYLDCPRQFELRYILKQECPPLSTAAQATVRQFADLGIQFHQMLHRHFIGLPVDEIAGLQSYSQIAVWWQQFSSADPLPKNLLVIKPELSLASRIENARLLAKLDLLVVTNDHHIIIYDWKTSPNLQSAQFLKTRVQSKLYPLVVSKMGQIDRIEFSPEQLSLIYWFPNFPEHPAVIHYSNAQMQADETFLSNLIEEIRALRIGDFQKTGDRRKCDYCDFYLICHKKKPAQSQVLTEMDDDLTLQQPLDAILDEDIPFGFD